MVRTFGMLEKQRIKHKQECEIEGKKEKQQVRNVRCAAVQMRCSRNVAENIEKAEVLVRQAAAEGAQVILLPELFERPYFCQERRYVYISFPYISGRLSLKSPQERRSSISWSRSKVAAIKPSSCLPMDIWISPQPSVIKDEP